MPSASREFQRIVDERGLSLRGRSYDELLRLDEPSHAVIVEGRRGCISTIIEPQEDGKIRVVVQGFLDGRFVRRFRAVALDGFYKDMTGAVSPMEAREFNDYG